MQYLCYLMQWSDYSLIDCGGQEKLERFGKYILRRPEPQAIWRKQASEKLWNTWDAYFIRSSDQAGGWQFKSKPLAPWFIQFQSINVKLQCTSFGHVGIFPEQISNWEFLHDQLTQTKNEKVLNLFAYTGMASLVARAAGADVYHIDAVNPMIKWAKENMEKSNLQDIHWVTEDAFKFLTREVNRNKSYHGIILDPPAYGRGPQGEKWLLADQIDETLAKCSNLLKQEGKFIILNMYSMGFSPMIAHELLKIHFPKWHVQSKELFIQAESGVKLPLGITALAIANK